MATVWRRGDRRHLPRGGGTGSRLGRQPRSGSDPLLLWLGALIGPSALVLTLVAAHILLSGPCGRAILFGLSSSQVIVASITILSALNAAAGGILCWHVWKRSAGPHEDRSGESLRALPFWAMGSTFLDLIFVIAIVLIGGLALGLSTTCGP